MQFALLVKSHANVRYAQSMLKLATIESRCLLYALNATAEIHSEMIAGAPFLVIQAESMSEEGWEYLSRHSAICLATVKDGEWLKPLALKRPQYMEPDLAQVLKYKGKTNADFTAMMLHCARSASAFALSKRPLKVMDPLCGRGTSLFCALEEGDSAIGLDMDEKVVHEADIYFEHYLKYHRYKHRRQETSLTLRNGGALRQCQYTFSNNAEDYKHNQTLTLQLVTGDTAHADEMVGAGGCHIIVADLPYGVQHAPRSTGGVGTLEGLLQNALPAYRRALLQGGAIALAFNTYTLPRAVVVASMQQAGFAPLLEPPFDDFSHWVEQAVNRDMVIAIKP